MPDGEEGVDEVAVVLATGLGTTVVVGAAVVGGADEGVEEAGGLVEDELAGATVLVDQYSSNFFCTIASGGYAFNPA